MAFLGVFILSGGGRCIQAHEAGLIKGGLSEETIQSIARIASVMQATTRALAMSQMDS